MNPIKWFFAVLVWIVVGLATLAAFLSIFILRLFDPQDKFVYKIANLWGKTIVAANPFWKLSVQDAHHLKPNKGYVLVANHSSLADIVCLYLIDHHFKWIAKESLFKIPVFGWTLSLLRYIPLSRGKHGSIRDSYQEAVKCLEKNISVLIFPEGTRSRTGQMAEFKNGAFKLALETGKPIVPVVIKGTSAAITKGKATMSLKVGGNVRVCTPIDVKQYGSEEFNRLKNDVWNLMKDELDRS